MWKDIKDYEGLYEINSSGHIRRKGSAKLLKQAKGKDYMQVSLCKCNHKVTKTVHRLVAETFLENPNELRCVNHKDENKLNNNVETLSGAAQNTILVMVTVYREEQTLIEGRNIDIQNMLNVEK